MKRLFILLLLFPYFSQAQRYFPPKGEWQNRTPESQGLNPDSVKTAIDYALAHEYTGSRDLRIAILEGFAREPYHSLLGPTKKRGGPAGLIIKNGYLVASWGDVSKVDMTFSVTKSYLSTVAGLAIEHGLIASVDDKVESYVWDGTFEGMHNKKISWRHLLNQSSDWSGQLFGIKDWADRPPREGGVDDWKSRELREPGSFFEYNDVRVNVLAYSLLQVWRQALPRVLKQHVMDPIGASTTWRWYGYEHSFVNVDGIMTQSVSGGGHSGGGVFINSLDHARFGLLFCRDGQWNDRQILSKDWIQAVQAPSDANESYGFMWWLNKGRRKWDGVPEHYFYAAGFGGNFIVVDQKNDMVIVTRWLNPADAAGFMKIVANSLKK